MLYIIYGGSGSGKSAYGEDMAVKLSKKRNSPLYYIATMYPYDEECEKRIKKHRSMRKDKGFETIECYGSLDSIVMEEPGVVLLECMSNLVANRMYGCPGYEAFIAEPGKNEKDGQALRDYHRALAADLSEEIQRLLKRAEDVVLISSNVFCDGLQYEKETEMYRKCLALLHHEIGKQADAVIEAVFGLPVVIKAEKGVEH